MRHHPVPPAHHSNTQLRWEEVHRRSRVLRRIVDTGRIDPEDPETRAVFADRDDLVRALFQQWATLIGASVDLALEVGEVTNARETLRSAHRAALRRAPELYRLVTEEAATPLGARLLERENLRLAYAVGLATPGTSTHDAAGQVADLLASVARPVASRKPSWLRVAGDWLRGREPETNDVRALLS
ncbi:hypothetical protein [Pimelobacter simplex]|uniref:hypothetical protein n=1 Tax=Nocardioides simplex TaxID=2045 RepID=UPI001933F048|nr:hypothetical protein [Pimelobacter simplex]